MACPSSLSAKVIDLFILKSLLHSLSLSHLIAFVQFRADYLFFPFFKHIQVMGSRRGMFAEADILIFISVTVFRCKTIVILSIRLAVTWYKLTRFF